MKAMMTFGGVFDRFLRLKVGSVEHELAWIPHWLNQMDFTYRERPTVTKGWSSNRPDDLGVGEGRTVLLANVEGSFYALEDSIGVDKIREFAGSLDEKGAVKGVFVTTSHFAPQAKIYSERSPKRLILIDGEELTRLMVQYGVGVRTFQKIELRKIDEDYFSADD